MAVLVVLAAAASSALASKGTGSPSFSGAPRDSMTSRSRTIRMLIEWEPSVEDWLGT